MSDSLQHHESHHVRPPCPSPTPGVHSGSMSIESVMPSSHLILCRPLLLPPIPLSIRVFSNESTLCMRWPKYWSFSFSIIPSKEIPGTIYRVPFIKDECMWQCAPQLDDTGLNSIFRQGHRSRSSAGQRLRLYSVIRQGHGLCSTVGKGWLGSLVG